MARKSLPEQDSPDLEQEIGELKDHIRLLVDAIDELRDQIQWLSCNVIPNRIQPGSSPVLKRMAADPMAEDWGERLEIVRGENSIPEVDQTQSIAQSASVTRPKPPGPSSGKLF